MDLSERKKKILSAVIETNIKNNNAEPVSSKQLQEEYLPKVSSATIRNELNALEEMGYLTHIHTSSGRVPTKEGYEKYISELMQEKKLSLKEKELIKSNFANKLVSLRDIIEKTASTISSATNYTTVVYSNPEDNSIIKDIKLYPVSKTTQLVLVVTSERVINELANLGTNDENELNAASTILKDLFVNKSLADIKDEVYRDKIVTSELQKYKIVFDRVIDIIESNKNGYSGNLSIAGKDKLMDYPEFNNIQKVKKAVSVLEDKDSIIPLIKSGNELELSISIGNEQNGLEDCSVVTVSCNISGTKKITAGIIGPMRMDYQKAVSVLKEVAETIENSLDYNIEGENND
ncbi:MAG: heat-inducible transcription repressor HrcA [Clostridia bacterium]|nr:heat-inducible transcription repressor HrcA [Clostridia bacterium]